MPEGWVRTTNVNIAAALATLGVPIKLDKATDHRTSREWRTILLGLETLPEERDMGLISAEEAGRELGEDELAREGTVAAKIQTKLILQAVHSGKLEKLDPAHPVLDAIGALHNRDCLCHWMQTGERYRLARNGDVPRFQLVRGEELGSVKQLPDGALFHTGDVKMVACLNRLGVPLARVGGEARRHDFYLPQTGYASGALPGIEVHPLVVRFRRGELQREEPGHPLLWCWQALANRERILDMMFRQREMLLVRDQDSPRAALVPHTPGDDKSLRRHMDKVGKFFSV